MSAARESAVVIGAGGVGCGVMTECLQSSGAQVVAITRTPAAAAVMQRHGARVRSTEPSLPDRIVRPDTVVPFTDAPRVVAHLAGASIIVVAVGPEQFVTVAPALAASLHWRRDPVNVLVCDNRASAPSHLHSLVSDHTEDSLSRHGFVGTLVDRIVTRHDDGFPLLVAEAASGGSILVDAHALRTPLPGLQGVRLVEDFNAHVLRKLFLFSAGHASAAYLGALRGHTHLREALADEEVTPVVRAAMQEGQAGLTQLFGPGLAGGPGHIDHCLRRFSDPTLNDTVARVGRDPLRKLAPQDRICGPARLALAAGVPTPALALVAVAALRAAGRGGTAPQRGRHLLSGSTGLPPDHPFLHVVESARRTLADQPSLHGAWSTLSATVGGTFDASRDRSGAW